MLKSYFRTIRLEKIKGIEIGKQGPLNNTENSAQYSVITYMEKEHEKNEYMHMYN